MTPGSRDELLAELLLERFGPIERKPRPRKPDTLPVVRQRQRDLNDSMGDAEPTYRRGHPTYIRRIHRPAA